MESSFACLLGMPLGSLDKSLPAGPPSGMPPLLLVTWGVHHKSGLSSALPLNQGESGLERKQPEPRDVLKGRHHQSDTVSLSAICN